MLQQVRWMGGGQRQTPTSIGNLLPLHFVLPPCNRLTYARQAGWLIQSAE